MSDLDHRVGVSEANLVVRHLKLVGITEDNIEAIIAGIDGDLWNRCGFHLRTPKVPSI